MNGIKCNACGLVNAEYNPFCRRCKQDLKLNPIPVLPSGADKGFSHFPYVLVAVVVGVIAVVTFGFYKSFHDVSAADDQRIERQQKEQADAMESRRAVDQERMQKVSKIIANINTHIPSREETQKALQPTLDKMQKENDRMRENAAKSEEMRLRSLPPPPGSH